MALELQYKFTFIDVDEHDPSEGQRHARCQSSPPSVGRRSATDMGMEVHDEENAMRGYVDMLKQKQGETNFARALSQKAHGPFGIDLDASPASTAPGSAGAWSPGQSTDADDSPVSFMEGSPCSGSPDGRVAALELLPSHGSLGHPEVCRRPCIYFSAGHCENGNACAYCHLPHMEKPPKLDKRQRTIIQGLSRQELMALVLEFCRTKAEQVGFVEEVSEVLELLEAESCSTRAFAATMSDRDIRNLNKTMSRMNFSNLIGLVTHQTPSRPFNASESSERLTVALERLRMCFLPEPMNEQVAR
ncbi:MTPC1 [Symbiodinium natans]|uniref:MTPC1 protein n=1 Tax=Symbiodinium natans TaxID=878477 RepID=A0A812HWS5_9DINO|nr:MTPC1 [Symbiodinium natans]